MRARPRFAWPHPKLYRSRCLFSQNQCAMVVGLDGTDNASTAGGAQCAPYSLRGDRKRNVADAKVPERVDHRIADRGGCTDRAALAAAFNSHWVAGRRRRDKGRVERRQIGCARYSVIHEARGKKLAGVLVINDMLTQRLSDPLRQPAVDLA